jgi:hypothetical protein
MGETNTQADEKNGPEVSDRPRCGAARSPLRAAFTWHRVSALITLCLLISVGWPRAIAASDDQTTSAKLVLVAKKIIIESAKVGLEEAGTRLMGSSWKYFKAALSPLFEELKRQYPSFARVLDTSGPGAQTEAARIADRLSTDPQLQALIVDGFANLKNGQREIINRIGEMQAVLYRQNESMMALQRASDEKLEKILAQVNELARQQPAKDYTENVTMYDLEGEWTMVGAQPPLPASCEFERGKYALVLKPVDALNATGDYAFPMPLDPDERALLGANTSCITVRSGNQQVRSVRVVLYGSFLRIPLSSSGAFYYGREVLVSADRMILSWTDKAEGRRNRWIFQRSP